MNYTVKPLDSSNGEVFTDFLGNLDFSLTPIGQPVSADFITATAA